jgi:hypothetical protein
MGARKLAIPIARQIAEIDGLEVGAAEGDAGDVFQG